MKNSDINLNCSIKTTLKLLINYMNYKKIWTRTTSIGICYIYYAINGSYMLTFILNAWKNILSIVNLIGIILALLSGCNHSSRVLSQSHNISFIVNCFISFINILNLLLVIWILKRIDILSNLKVQYIIYYLSSFCMH